MSSASSTLALVPVAGSDPGKDTNLATTTTTATATATASPEAKSSSEMIAENDIHAGNAAAVIPNAEQTSEYLNPF